MRFLHPTGVYHGYVIQREDTLYVWGDYGLLRSTDGAATWEQWIDWPENFIQLPQESLDPEAVAIDEVFPLPADNGRHTLLIINDQGQYLVAAPETLAWQQMNVVDRITQQWQALGGSDGPLGHPLTPVIQGELDTRPFEHGLWWHVKWLDQFYFLTFLSRDEVESGVTWSQYQNGWKGEPDYSSYPCPEAAPYSLHNELGWLWCNHQQIFGVPAGTQRTWSGWYQQFEGGVMLTPNQNDTIHILFNNGNWETTGPVIKELLPVIPTVTPSPVATATTPSAAESPTTTSEPEIPVEPPYLSIWQELGGGNGALGRPKEAAVEGPYAFQQFERGFMHWGWQMKNAPYIHSFIYGADHQHGGWYRVVDNWQPGEEEYSCDAAQPPLGPRRGFGKMWCADSDLRQSLGGPVEPEQGSQGGYQTFEYGVMLWHAADGRILILFEDGRWISEPTDGSR